MRCTVLLLILLKSWLFGANCADLALLEGIQGARAPSFRKLMGDHTWIKTSEDRQKLSEYASAYREPQPDARHIPHVLHLIWLGPMAPPDEAVRGLLSWLAMHPKWQCKLWTDWDRQPPHPRVQICHVRDVAWQQLEEYFYASDSVAEKSELLRYEILWSEGGVYVDCDTLCVQPLDVLNEGYDFYCGLELPQRTVLSSSIVVSTHLIGAMPAHPVLQHTLDWLSEHWTLLGQQFHGSDPKSVYNRVKHRSFRALEEGVKRGIGQRGVVLPALYFSSPKATEALFAAHLHLGSWHKDRKQEAHRICLQGIRKRINRTLTSLWTLVGLDLGALLFAMRRRVAR